VNLRVQHIELKSTVIWIVRQLRLDRIDRKQTGFGFFECAGCSTRPKTGVAWANTLSRLRSGARTWQGSSSAMATSCSQSRVSTTTAREQGGGCVAPDPFRCWVPLRHASFHADFDWYLQPATDTVYTTVRYGSVWYSMVQYRSVRYGTMLWCTKKVTKSKKYLQLD